MKFDFKGVYFCRYALCDFVTEFIHILRQFKV